MVKIMVRKLFNNKLFKLIFLIPLLIVPLVLFILPSDFFDEGDSVCLSVMLFNIECYGCGMTRAIMHFIHFDCIPNTVFRVDKNRFISTWKKDYKVVLIVV